MVGKRRISRRGPARVAAALIGAGALMGGTLTLLSVSVGIAAPAGASTAPASATTPSTGSIVSDIDALVADLSLSNVGGYIEGHTQCPVSEVGYLIAGAVGPPPCAPGQIGG